MERADGTKITHYYFENIQKYKDAALAK